MTLPTAKGTDTSATVWFETIWLATGAIPGCTNRFEWIEHPGSEPIIIPTGAANGIAVKNTAGIATSTVGISIEWVETGF